MVKKLDPELCSNQKKNVGFFVSLINTCYNPNPSK